MSASSPARVARTTCCPGACSAQEVTEKLTESVELRKSLVTSCGLRPPGQQVVRATQSHLSSFPNFIWERLLPLAKFHFALISLILLFTFPAHADITGTVTLTGKPASKDETFVAPVSGCGESAVRSTENWKVGPKGELGDVVVWIIDPKFKPPTPPPVVTQPPLPPSEIEVKQLGCRYTPHVIAVQQGVPFKIINADPTLHNIRAKVSDGPGKPPGTDVFNFGETRQGQAEDRQFDSPGIYTLQCDVHPWMQCWVMVLRWPCFGVSTTDGIFKLRDTGNLLDGDYKIDAWHPRFGQQLEQTIHVKNGSATVNFQFDGAKSF